MRQGGRLRYGWLLLCLLAGQALAEAGVFPDRVVLGMANALSGPAAALGTELRDGALACFARINAEGGVNGRRIELVSLDDGYEPLRSEAATRRLIEEHRVFALFGYVGTPTSAAAVRVAKRHHVPYIAPFTGAEFLRTPVSPLVFNVRASYYDEAEMLVRQAVDRLGLRRIAVAAQDDSFGDTVRAGINRAMYRRGASIVGEGRFRRNSSEVAAAVGRISAAAPEVVIMVGGYVSVAAFVREYRRTGQAPLLMTVSFVGTAGFVREEGPAGEGVVITQVVPSPFDESHPLVARYRRDSEAFAPGRTAGYGGLEGCLDALVFAEALNRAGREPDRKSLAAAFESMRGIRVAGIRVDYSANRHQGMSEVYLTRIVGGRPLQVKELDRR